MEIERLGIPAAKVNQFHNSEIFTVEDLLKYFPKKYLDFRFVGELNDSNIGKEIAVIGKIKSCQIIGKARKFLRVQVETNAGIVFDVFWFNQDYLYDKYCFWNGVEVVVCGKLFKDRIKYKNYTFVNPMFFEREVKDVMKIFPVYKKIRGMSDDYLKRTITSALKYYRKPDYLSQNVKDKFRLCNYESLYELAHHPKDGDDISAAKRRMIFDDMYYFASKLFEESIEQKSSKFIPVKTDTVKKVIREIIPFKLTDDQMKTVAAIVNTVKSGKRLNALVQGDVGSGKTIVAFLSMILFAENGYQSVIMAPTQVLANQHYGELQKIAEKIGTDVVLLKSKMKVKEKRDALKKIESGEAKLIVGTHSVFSQDVIYKNLGIVITDEEHKFGVVQREAIVEKAKDGVHCITMSATPIPRTLANTLYGIDKEVFTITQMPAGRKPVITEIENDEKEIIRFIHTRLLNSEQAYVICPLIEKSDCELFDKVEDVEKVFENFSKYFNKCGYKVEMITGKTKSSEQERILNDFNNNKISVLISTTIIEVGVNVPNCNTIVIKNAERFGLAQLHQLRGRVGRGKKQGYCILQSDDSDNERLSVMCKTNNGFEVAEADLKYRGSGDLIGTKQSGENKYVSLMLMYPRFFEKVKQYVLSVKKEGS